jgi:hypothetical protein
VALLWHDYFMKAHPSAKPEQTAFQKFEAFTRRVMSIPKTEIDRRAAEEKKRREAARRVKR